MLKHEVPERLTYSQLAEYEALYRVEAKEAKAAEEKAKIKAKSR